MEGRWLTWEDAQQACWQLMVRGARKGGDPLHTAVLGTLGKEQAEMRTAVVRRVIPAERRLWFFSDARAPKIQQVQATGRLSILFYHPRKQIQIRLAGQVSCVRETPELAVIWEQLPSVARQLYAAPEVPGSPRENTLGGSIPAAGLSDAEAFRHFLLLDCQIDSMDGLYLHPEGHQRFTSQWATDKWIGTWIVP